MLKDGCEVDSEIVGSLTEGTVIRCLERKTNLEGQDRVRCNKGWVSVVAKDGSVLLEQVGGQGNAATTGPGPQMMHSDAENPIANANLERRAQVAMRARRIFTRAWRNSKSP
jgi:hypothetical protein